MKKLCIVLFTSILLTMSLQSFAQDPADEPCTTDACQAQQDALQMFAEWQANGYPEWMANLISDALETLLVAVGTERPMVLPFNAYPSGEEIGYLRLTVEAQFGPDLSSLISDESLANVWGAIEEEFGVEFAAAHNGLTSTSAMSYYLLNTGALLQTFDLRWVAQSKMNGYNLANTYLVPSTSSSVPGNLANPHYLEDWDTAQKFLLGWPSYRTETWQDNVALVKRFINSGKKVYILVDSAVWHRAVLYMLNNSIPSIPMSTINANVKFMYIKSDWMDVRTSSPFFVNTSSGVVAVCPKAGVPWAPIADDQQHCLQIAKYLGIPYKQTTYGDNYLLHLEGGNFLTDGEGTAFVSDAVFRDFFNPGLTQEMLEASLYQYLGITDVVILPFNSVTSAGHVEDWIAVLDSNTVMVPSGLYQQELLDTVADLIALEGYTVVRLPLPIRMETDIVGTSMRTFSHMINTGGSIFVPAFGDVWHPISAIQDLVVQSQLANLYPEKSVQLVRWATPQAQGPRYCTKSLP